MRPKIAWSAKSAEKPHFQVVTAAPKAGAENKPVMAALKAVRYPKSSAGAGFARAGESLRFQDQSYHEFAALFLR
jgi:hypothetical protein